MNDYRGTRLLHGLLLVLAAASAADAQWLDNGNVICGVSGDQYEIALVSDDAGGAVIVWRDERLNDANIFGQRIDGGGARVWPNEFGLDGIVICGANGTQESVAISNDGSGETWLAWTDRRLGPSTGEIYVQRLSGDGQALWAADGRWVNFGAAAPGIVHDGADGAFVFWAEAVTYPTSVAVQRLDSAGSTVWPDYAVAGLGYNISGVLDGAGGLVLGWQRFYATSYDNYVLGQRIDGNGTTLWPSSAVSPTYYCEFEGEIAPDGSGGGLWSYTSAGQFVVQRVDGAGNLLWGPDGVNPFPAFATGDQGEIAVVSDGAGGALVVSRNSDLDIHVNRIAAGGNRVWGDSGVAICSHAADARTITVAPDGQGGIYVAWQDYRDYVTTSSDIYAEHVDGAGTLLWGGNGVAVCDAAGSQGAPRITASGSSAIVAWTDLRSGEGFRDIYAQALHIDGNIGDPPIRIGNRYPAPNATGAPVDTDLVVDFTSAAAPGTDWAGSIFVHGERSGLHIGAANYDPATRTLTFNPTMDFAPGEVVQITLTSGIGTVTGYTLEPRSWSFTTATAVTGGLLASGATEYDVGPSPISICAADFEGDLLMDVAVANNWTNTVSVLSGNGAGGFLPQTVFTTLDNPNDIIAADLDRDGHMDLVTVHAASDEIAVLINSSSGFLPPSSYPVGDNPQQACAADFDGDGDFDLAVATNSTGPGSVFVLYNLGAGNFSAAAPRNAGYFLSSVTAGDFDLDGHMDIVCGSSSGTDRISVLLGRGDGSFAPKIDTDPGSDLRWLAAADVDGDLALDLLAVSRVGGFSTFINVIPNGGAADFGPPTSSLPGGRCLSYDMNGDHAPDLVHLVYDGLAVQINDGTGGFSTGSSNATGYQPVDLCAADFNGDGALDIAFTNSGGNSVGVLTSIPEGSGVGTAPPRPLFGLVQNTPNPFNPRTRIIYTLRQAGHARLTIHDARGTEIAVLVDGRRDAREHSVEWNGRDSTGRRVASGAYFCRLVSGEHEVTMKMTLLK